jgi:hypothetical protein
LLLLAPPTTAHRRDDAAALHAGCFLQIKGAAGEGRRSAALILSLSLSSLCCCFCCFCFARSSLCCFCFARCAQNEEEEEPSLKPYLSPRGLSFKNNQTEASLFSSLLFFFCFWICICNQSENRMNESTKEQQN